MSATAIISILQVWLPAPSWANHNAIFSSVGLEVGAYAYYDKSTCGFDFEGAKADIKVSNQYGQNVLYYTLLSLVAAVSLRLSN